MSAQVEGLPLVKNSSLGGSIPFLKIVAPAAYRAGVMFQSQSTINGVCLMLVGAALTGCRAEDPGEDTGTTMGSSGGTMACAAVMPSLSPFEGEGCGALASDYQPGVNGSADDAWPACVSDDRAYHLVDSTPSTIARVEAYEAIADRLWRNGTPTTQDFSDARTIYAQAEGLESRLVRREDLHFPPVPMEDWQEGIDPDKQCTVPSNVTKYPERCAGPAKVAPLINDAFSAGQLGDGDPDVHAARVQASLLWFLYLSTYKEANTCATSKSKDCDSSWAYYTGGADLTAGLGLAGEVRGQLPAAHEAIYDGVLAVRCWRDLYSDSTYPTWDDIPQEGQTLFDRGVEQLDNALHHGFMLVVRDRLLGQGSITDEREAAVNWAFLQIAGPVLSREVGERDAGALAVLDSVWQATCPTAQDLEMAVTTLDETFPCSQP